MVARILRQGHILQDFQGEGYEHAAQRSCAATQRAVIASTKLLSPSGQPTMTSRPDTNEPIGMARRSSRLA